MRGLARLADWRRRSGLEVVNGDLWTTLDELLRKTLQQEVTRVITMATSGEIMTQAEGVRLGTNVVLACHAGAVGPRGCRARFRAQWPRAAAMTDTIVRRALREFDMLLRRGFHLVDGPSLPARY